MSQPMSFLRAGIERASNRSLHQQLYERIRRAVLVGRLSEGARLPSTRNLAAELGLARGTVDGVYARLVAEGYLTARRQQGTFVTAGLRRRSALRSVQARSDTRSAEPAQSWLPLQLGLPAMDLFPRAMWKRIASKQVRQPSATGMIYPDSMGLPVLRTAIAGYLAVSRGVACSEDQIVITYGYQDALNLAVDLLLTAGDRVWIEDPGYGFAQRALLARGMSLAPIPVDAEGLRVAWGLSKAPRARLAVITPSHQFPTGATLSPSRRWEILNWASQARSWILEDDYDCEFHYIGHKPAALKAMDLDARVLYAGSFSKSLFPALRLGYLVLPGKLVEPARRLQSLRHRGAAILPQLVVAEFMTRGYFARHLRRMRIQYGSRRDALRTALVGCFGSRIDIVSGGGGLHIMARFHGNFDDVGLAARALELGLKPSPLSGQFLKDGGERGLLLSFTNVPEERAPEIASTLLRIARNRLRV